MKNEPVAWINEHGEISIEEHWAYPTPLYTHPAKKLHLSLQKDKETGELLAVTYTDDEHRIVEVLWQRLPVKELTLSPDEIFDIWDEHTDYDGNFVTSVDDFVFAILRKAQENG